MYIDKIFSFDILNWLLTSGIKIALIIVGALIFWWILKAVIEKAIRKTVVLREGQDKETEKKREDTLIKTFRGIFRVTIIIVVSLMILSEIGLDIGPLIAAAGIIGVAVGFGAQYLIRDIISGFFIIFENQYRVNDTVCFDSTCGTVEDITLRIVMVRDLDGTVHHIPHGEVKKVSNLSKGFSRVNLDVGVGYDSDLDKVEKVVNEVGEELAKDEKFGPMIISAPRFVRVNKLGDSAVDIKILGDVKPLRQWDVTGELRKRIKIAFDKEGIDIPFPQRTIHND